MDLAVKIQERVNFMDDKKKKLVLELVENLMPYADEEDELTEEDLYYIALAEEEYANGETTSHNDINWD